MGFVYLLCHAHCPLSSLVVTLVHGHANWSTTMIVTTSADSIVSKFIGEHTRYESTRHHPGLHTGIDIDCMWRQWWIWRRRERANGW
jgi:hypothetical protein